MKYRICYGNDVESLEEVVNNLLEAGWFLSGDLLSHNGMLYQAMYRV